MPTTGTTKKTKKRKKDEKKSFSASSSSPSVNEKLGWAQLQVEQGPKGNQIKAFHPAQLAVMRKMLEPTTRRFLALWKVGSGKTLLAVLCTQALLKQSFEKHNIRRKAVLVVGKSLLSRFKSELYAYGRSDRHLLKYYSFWTYQKAMLHWKAFGRECRNNIVVIDEIHFLRSMIQASVSVKKEEKETKKGGGLALKGGNCVTKGRRAAAIMRGARRAWKMLGMTATPMVNFVSDIINLGYIMSPQPKSYLDAWMKSAKHYQKIDKSGGWDALSATDIKLMDDAFLGKVHCWMTDEKEKEKQENELKMPTSLETNVLIEMDEETFVAYQEVEQSEQARLQQRGETKLKSMGMFYNGVRRAVNKIGFVPSQKINFLLSLVMHHHQRKEKGIITSAWLEYGTSLVVKELAKHNIKIVLLTGDQSEEARTLAVEQFNSDHADVIVLSGAGSTGIDLHGAAYHVNIEGHWNETSRKQANGRGVRMGSHRNSKFNHVMIYNLILCKPKFDFIRAYILMQTVISLQWPGAPQKVIMKSISSAAAQEKKEDKNKEYSTAMDQAYALLQMVDPSWKSPLTDPNAPTTQPKKKEKKKKIDDCSIDVYLWLLQLKKSRSIHDFTQSILYGRWNIAL